MPSSFFRGKSHSFFQIDVVVDINVFCPCWCRAPFQGQVYILSFYSQKVLVSVHDFFYGGSSFEGNSTVWQLHHFRDSSESFDLQSRQLWEQGKRTGSVNSWFSHLSVCNVHSRFFIFFWIKILNSQFHTPSTPHLAKPAKTWLILSTFWALKRELKLAKFAGKEYGKMIGRWTNWHNIKIISRKWMWKDDWEMNKLTQF